VGPNDPTVPQHREKQRTYLRVTFGIACAFSLGVSQPRSGAPNLNPQGRFTRTAVGGGKVLLIVLESNDNPPDWSVDVLATNGYEYEVKVNLYTRKVLAIIIGG
jgi:hypothetical protein